MLAMHAATDEWNGDTFSIAPTITGTPSLPFHKLHVYDVSRKECRRMDAMRRMNLYRLTLISKFQFGSVSFLWYEFLINVVLYVLQQNLMQNLQILDRTPRNTIHPARLNKYHTTTYINIMFLRRAALNTVKILRDGRLTFSSFLFLISL